MELEYVDIKLTDRATATICQTRRHKSSDVAQSLLQVIEMHSVETPVISTTSGRTGGSSLVCPSITRPQYMLICQTITISASYGTSMRKRRRLSEKLHKVEGNLSTLKVRCGRLADRYALHDMFEPGTRVVSYHTYDRYTIP